MDVTVRGGDGSGRCDWGGVFGDFLVQVINGDVFVLTKGTFIGALLLLNQFGEIVELLLQNLDFLVFLVYNPRRLSVSLSPLSEQLVGQSLDPFICVDQFFSKPVVFRPVLDDLDLGSEVVDLCFLHVNFLNQSLLFVQQSLDLHPKLVHQPPIVSFIFPLLLQLHLDPHELLLQLPLLLLHPQIILLVLGVLLPLFLYVLEVLLIVPLHLLLVVDHLLEGFL